jgi:hypothetical protein
MMFRRPFRVLLAVAAIAMTAGNGLAEYDREGRYVPSPGGIPSDPYARPIPGYSGTPGGAIGTPSLPRYLYPPPAVITQPRQTVPANVLPSSRPLSIEQCHDGWSKSTRVTPTEFKRRCSLMLRRENNH